MSDEPLILAIDNGTQSTRALLFNTRGDLIAKGREEIEPYVSPEPGWAEQETDYYWQSIGHACRALWANTDARPEQVKGVTVTAQRGTVVNLDANGEVLRPAIIWLDQRRAPGPVTVGPFGA